MNALRTTALSLAALATTALATADAQTATVTRGSLDLAIGPRNATPPTNYRVGAGTGLDFDGEFLGDFRPTDFVQVRNLYAFFDPGAACTLEGGTVRVELFTQQTDAQGEPLVRNTQSTNLTRQRDCSSPDFRSVGVNCSGDLAEYGSPGSTFNIFLGSYDGKGLVDLRVTWTPEVASGCSVQALTGTATLTVGNVAPVPAELTAFSAVADGSEDVVSWSTASEIDVARFLLERSLGADGAFEVVAEEWARGDVSRAVDYRVALAGAAGPRYYRLVTVDEDGTRETSEVAVVTGGARALALVAYPNPVVDRLTVTTSGLTGERAAIVVYDALGRVVLERVAAGTDAFELDTSGLPEGSYRLSVRGGQQVATQSFRVVR